MQSITNPIQKHLATKQFREERLWMLRNGVWQTEVDGYVFDEIEFSECFPVFNPVTFIQRKENIDGKTKFMRL